MGLSNAISGGIVLLVGLNVIGVIGGTLGSQEIFEAKSEISLVQDSLSKTNLNVLQVSAVPGDSFFNFTLANEGTEKLWNFDQFDILIFYDADVSGNKIKTFEMLKFEPESSFLGASSTNSTQGSPSEFARPNGVVSGNWSQANGCTAGLDEFLCLDEIVQQDSDFIGSELLFKKGEIDQIEFSLSNVSDPQSESGHIVRYTYRETDLGNADPSLQVTLLQGTTTIAEWTESGKLPSNFSLSTQTLTSSQANNITDYSDLRIRLGADCSDCPAGSPTGDRIEVSWIELQVSSGLEPESVTCVTNNNLASGEWVIGDIVNDILDPMIINTQEAALICINLSNPIFPGSNVELVISTDSGFTKVIKTLSV